MDHRVASSRRQFRREYPAASIAGRTSTACRAGQRISCRRILPGKEVSQVVTVTGEIPQRVYRTGALMLLAGVAMFFMALVSAEIVRKGFSSDWQPLNLPWRFLWLSTAILIASSLALARSRSRLLARDDAGFRHWWGITAILGLFFVAGIAIAWRQLLGVGVGMATNPSSSFFYVFTAAHALHVLGGVAALAAVAFRPLRRLSRITAADAVSVYWHAICGLWVLLILLLLIER